MSLSRAKLPDGTPVSLPGEAPFASADLTPLRGVPFQLPCEDDFLDGTGTEAHAYLDGAASSWLEFPDWMDVVDAESPVHDIKAAERDLYLHWWREWLHAPTVLDVGCGVGRMTMPFLDRGATVIGVDGDLGSLQRCAWHAAERSGRLDLHWSSVHKLPPGQFDVVIAAEVLCYVPDVERALAAIVERLKPGGALLLSMEGRWGWATAQDAPEGSAEEALAGTGIVHEPGERWVRTWEGDELTALLQGAGLQVDTMLPCFYFTDGPLERTLGSASLEELIIWEVQARKHPVWGPLNRMWVAVAVKPND